MTDTPEAVRLEFERYFIESRKSKGANRTPTFERFEDGTYKDDHTQRHWWTWQNALLRRIPELEEWKAKVIKAAEEAHGPGAFRFKMSLNSRGTASNVFPQWLDQRWVSFVYAEDDAHVGLHARIAQLEVERDQLRAELGMVRVPEGWVLVPVDPTREMLDRGSHNVNCNYHYGTTESIAKHAYKAMLSAAPTPPHADQKGQ